MVMTRSQLGTIRCLRPRHDLVRNKTETGSCHRSTIEAAPAAIRLPLACHH